MNWSENDIRRLSPLIDEAGFQMLRELREHPDAPLWNVHTGDRLEREDLAYLERFLARLRQERRPCPAPPAWLIEWTRSLYDHVPLFRRNIGRPERLTGDWESIASMTREDIALRLGDVVPENADLSQLIKYGTSGTTGHPIMVPHHPRAVAHYQIFIRYLLELYGIEPGFHPGVVAAFEVCYQRETVTFATVLSLWQQAGFAKINLHPGQWPTPQSCPRFFEAMAPRILTGDPISFSHLLDLQIAIRPRAAFSTAMALSPALKKKFEQYFQCPVIDWYSLNETGPIAYSCRCGEGYHLLPHDLYVEIVDPSGKALPAGERGEITVSGGRNPFVPLLRYRTGDWAALTFEACSCGDPMPRLIQMEGREPVLLRRADGTLVNPVDVSRILGGFPIGQYRFVQHRDYSCELTIRPVPAENTSDGEAVRQALQALFGPDLPITIAFDPKLGSEGRGGKVVAYLSELEAAL